MRYLLIVLTLLSLQDLSAQLDTITVADYTNVFVSSDNSGKVSAVTSLSGIQQAGFFLSEIPEGKIRVCNDEEVNLWVDGRLIENFEGCKYYDPSYFFEFSESDTIYISVSSPSLKGIVCDLVIFEDLKIVKEEQSLPRNIRDSFNEFAIISLLIIGCVWGLLIAIHPNRVKYLFNRSLSVKRSSYEFIDTQFFHGASLHLLSFFSLSLAFIIIYCDTILSINLFTSEDTTISFLQTWMKLSGVLLVILIVKWMLILFISSLFKFKGLRNFQLFDYLNFNSLIVLVVLIFISTDFVFHASSDSIIGIYFLAIFPISAILFILWFAFKFVSNSPHKKLTIISYLCATEIIPVVLLMGILYK